jgi:DNA polymerase III epsilon subunit-like protein
MDIHFNLPVVILDCEMSGSNVDSHQLLEIGAYLCDSRNLGILDKFYQPIGPDEGKSWKEVLTKADKKALEVTKINIENYQYSPSIKDVLVKLDSWLPKHFIWVGFDIYLDYAFLKKYLDSFYKGSHKLLTCRKLDIKVLSELYLVANMITEPLSLENIASLQGMDTRLKHTAMGDCTLIRDVFKELMENIYVSRE